jgi:hypothetical protein
VIRREAITVRHPFVERSVAIPLSHVSAAQPA